MINLLQEPNNCKRKLVEDTKKTKRLIKHTTTRTLEQIKKSLVSRVKKERSNTIQNEDSNHKNEYHILTSSNCIEEQINDLTNHNNISIS